MRLKADGPVVTGHWNTGRMVEHPMNGELGRPPSFHQGLIASFWSMDHI